MVDSPWLRSLEVVQRKFDSEGRCGVKLRDSNISWQRLDDEIVVLDVSGSSYFKVNGTGTTLWERLASGADQSELVHALVQDYQIDSETAERDVEAFLADLRAAKLLEE